MRRAAILTAVGIPVCAAVLVAAAVFGARGALRGDHGALRGGLVFGGLAAVALLVSFRAYLRTRRDARGERLTGLARVVPWLAAGGVAIGGVLSYYGVQLENDQEAMLARSYCHDALGEAASVAGLDRCQPLAVECMRAEHAKEEAAPGGRRVIADVAPAVVCVRQRLGITVPARQ